MFKRRILCFHKRILEGDSPEYYRAISDAALMAEIIEIAKYYDLKIKKIKLQDFCGCKVILKGDRDSFLCFIAKLAEKCGKYINEIDF